MNAQKNHRPLSWAALITMVLFSCCGTVHDTAQPASKKGAITGNRLAINAIRPGDPIRCVQSLERKMKSSKEHVKYIVTLHGTVEKIAPPEVFIRVEAISVKNLKKEKATWVRNRAIVKKPPFTIGNTYAIKARHEVMDNAVSKGVYDIYFVAPD